MTVNVRLRDRKHTPHTIKTMLKDAQEHPCLFNLSMTERHWEGNEYEAMLLPKRYGDYNSFNVEVSNEDFCVSLDGNSVHSLLKELNVSGVGIGHSIGFWRSLGVDIKITDEIIDKATNLVESGGMDKGSISLLKNAKYEQG